MKKNISYFILFILALNIFQFTSCKKELSEPNWDVDLLTPLAKATLTVNNIYNDTTKKINADNSISMVYSSGLYDFTLDTLFKIPDTTVTYSARLSNIDLGVIDVTHRTSLGDIANKDKETNGINSNLYQTIMQAHNTGTPTVIDPIAEQIFDSLDIDASQYFQTATLSNGFMDIKIDNQLPIAISNLVFQIRNRSNNMLVLQDTFPLIPSHAYMQQTKSLAGLTVEGHLYGYVKISSPGSGSAVTIDTSQALTAQIIIRDVAVSSAVANFPGQNIVDKKEKTSFKMGDVQLSKVLAKSGNINIDVYNTLHETLHFNYKMYSASKNGTILQLTGTIPPASNGTASHTVINKDLQGYTINMKGIGPVEAIYGDLDGNGVINGDTVNTIYSVLTGTIDSSGNQISLSLQDSIYFKCVFTNLIPEYIEGFLGKDTLTENGSFNQDIISQLVGASLDFNDVKVSLNFSNQIGVGGQIKINQLKATNTSNNQTATLNIFPSTAPFYIIKPVNPFSSFTDVVPTINFFQLNNTNSNINQLINVIPNQFQYSVQIFLNAGISTPASGLGTDFVYYGDKINARLDIEVPLSVIAGNVILNDTTKFSLGTAKTNQIIGGNLILITDNLFPVEATPQVYLLDSLNQILDVLIPSGAKVEAGDVDATTHRVKLAKRSKIIIPITPQRLDLLKKTKKVKTTASFLTRPQDNHVKFYNDYTMKFKLIGDFNYLLHQ